MEVRKVTNDTWRMKINCLVELTGSDSFSSLFLWRHLPNQSQPDTRVLLTYFTL